MAAGQVAAVERYGWVVVGQLLLNGQCFAAFGLRLRGLARGCEQDGDPTDRDCQVPARVTRRGGLGGQSLLVCTREAIDRQRLVVAARGL